jgi:hypothetical protein
MLKQSNFEKNPKNILSFEHLSSQIYATLKKNLLIIQCMSLMSNDAELHVLNIFPKWLLAA